LERCGYCGAELNVDELAWRQQAAEIHYPKPREVPPPPRVGRWGFIGGLVPVDLMPPDEDARHRNTPNDGEVIFQCKREEPPYIVVRNDAGVEYRVNPLRFFWIYTPIFQIGDQVRTTAGTNRTGWISARIWHFERMELFYLIEILKHNTRKLHTRRYFTGDLESFAEETN
jgi:hypothetical protein